MHRSAVRYTAEGTPVEIISRARTAPRNGNGSGAAIISVRDHGDGVADEVIDKSFARSRTADASATRVGGAFGGCRLLHAPWLVMAASAPPTPKTAAWKRQAANSHNGH